MTITTKNIARMEVRKPRTHVRSLLLDGKPYPTTNWPLKLGRDEPAGFGAWNAVGEWKRTHKNPDRYGGFKLGLQNRMIFVYGTQDSDSSKLYAFARSMAEKLYYQGNGAVDIWTDSEYLRSRNRDRNVVLFGNEDDNLAWKPLLGACPISVRRGSIVCGPDPRLIGGNPMSRTLRGNEYAALIAYPLPNSSNALVLGFGVTGNAGIDVIQRLPMLSSGAAYPDYSIFDAGAEAHSGIKGVVLAGNFGSDWSFDLSFSHTPEGNQGIFLTH